MTGLIPYKSVAQNWVLNKIWLIPSKSIAKIRVFNQDKIDPFLYKIDPSKSVAKNEVLQVYPIDPLLNKIDPLLLLQALTVIVSLCSTRRFLIIVSNGSKMIRG